MPEFGDPLHLSHLLLWGVGDSRALGGSLSLGGSQRLVGALGVDPTLIPPYEQEQSP